MARWRRLISNGMQLVSHSPQETQQIAADLARKILAGLSGNAQAAVVALSGELGSGKTTFTQGFAKALGIAERPKSPTFLLAKQYAIPGTRFSLWHLDCYRLRDHRDLVSLDLHHIFSDPGNIVLVEWPENIGSGLPPHIGIKFTHQGPEKRGISIRE